MPKVTVVLPTYNRAYCLGEAIQSVLNQTFQDYEILVLDNASTDNTADVVQMFQDNRIRYILNERNIGATANHNKGLDMASGEYISIFSDDDIMRERMLERQVDVLEREKDVVLVASNIDTINEEGKIIKERLIPIAQDATFEKYEYILRDTGAVFLPFPTVMVRKEFLDKNNLRFNEDVGPCCDAYLLYQINLSPRKIFFISDSLLKYRIHKNQDSSQSHFYESQLKLYRSIHKLLEQRNSHHLLPKVKSFAINTMLRYLMSTYQSSDKFIELKDKLCSEIFWTDEIAEDIKLKLELFECLCGSITDEKLSSLERNQEDDENLELLYRRWINFLLTKKRGISGFLREQHIRRVSIFGSMFNAYLLLEDMKREKIEVVCLLDNNLEKQHQVISGIKVYSVDSFLKSGMDCDAIVTSIEGLHDLEIKNRLIKQTESIPIHVFSWRDLIGNIDVKQK